MSLVDYNVRLSKIKETVYHVNMLKEWFEREVPVLQQTKSTHDVKISEGLILNQRNQIQRLVEEFNDIITDVPKRTSLTHHTVENLY